MSEEILFEEALRARNQAYAVYSTFKVGAAVRTTTGKIFCGCNIENISFGLTICAERVAIFNAIQGGFREFDALAIVSESNEPVVPCGACRQVLAEFAPELKVWSSTLSGLRADFNLAELLPLPRQGILGGST